MHDQPSSNRTYHPPQGVIALLFGLAYLAERASFLPGPVRWAVLFILRRGEKSAYQLVYWAARDCAAPLQWAAPDYVRESSDPDAAIMLGRWFRILALALRDLPRRALIVEKNKAAWASVLRFRPAAHGLAPVANAPDTS